MDSSKIKELRSKARALNPVAHIGKEGITPKVIEEISRQLRQQKLIKIRAPPAFFEGKSKKEVARALAAQVNAELIDQVGFMIVLAKANM